MLSKRNPQLNKNGELIHLLSTEGLSRDILTHILDTASSFVSVNDREVKKVPLLRGKSVFNLFFENSTRTRTTFEIAAKRLSADVINLDIARSSAAASTPVSCRNTSRSAAPGVSPAMRRVSNTRSLPSLWSTTTAGASLNSGLRIMLHSTPGLLYNTMGR